MTGLLTDGHALVVLLPGRTRSALMIVSAASAELSAFPDTIDVRPGVHQLLEAAVHEIASPSLGPAAEPSSGDRGARRARRWMRRADELRDALLSPEVCAQLAKFRRLTICGAGMLHNLPFELLPIEVDGEERYLGEVTAIDYVANLVRAYEARPRRDPERVLLTASLRTTRGGLTPYDVRRPQLQEMRERYPDGVTMFDDEVQVGRLVEQLEQADVVHLIGHGFAEPGRIYQNGIVFSDAEGDALWGDRIVGRRLDGVVVILGSCGIGNAPYRRGGEPLAASLPGAMLAAGARCVIVPMSDLAYGNHEAAMQTLHAELVRGTTPADAMLIARRALAEAGRGDAWLELMMMQVHGRGF